MKPVNDEATRKIIYAPIFSALISATVLGAAIKPAVSADASKPLTVLECLTVLKGLDAMGCAGKQLDGPACAPDAKQYKLGALRVTIGMNLARLQDESNVVQRAQNDFISKEIPPSDPKDPNSAAERQRKAQENWNNIIDDICPVTPGHLPLSGLKIGDGPDENAFPPPVLGALMQIIDQDK